MQMKNISSHATRPSLVALSPVVVVERRVRAIDGDVARDEGSTSRDINTFVAS